MNFIIDLAHCGVLVADWLGHQSVESEGLRFNSSWGLRIFSLSHTHDKMKKQLSLIIIVFQKEFLSFYVHFQNIHCPYQSSVQQDIADHKIICLFSTTIDNLAGCFPVSF